MDERRTNEIERGGVRACEQTALLDAYVDGELPQDQAEALREHLDGCPACRAYLDDIRAIREAFPTVEDTQVPEGFAERVLDRLPARITVLGNWRRRELWRRAALPVAASLALLLALRGVWLTGGAGGTDEIMSRNLPVVEETVQESSPAVTSLDGADDEAAVSDSDSAVTESEAAVTESEAAAMETEETDNAAEPVDSAMDSGTLEMGVTAAAGATETAVETGAANEPPSPSTEAAPASQGRSQADRQANHQTDSRSTQTSNPGGGTGGKTGSTGNNSTNTGKTGNSNTSTGNAGSSNTSTGNAGNSNTGSGNTAASSTAASGTADSGKTAAEMSKTETSPAPATPVTPAASTPSYTPQVPQPENSQEGWIPREWETGGLSPVSGYEDTEGTASLMGIDDFPEEPGSSEEMDGEEAGEESGEDTADHSLSLPPEAAEYLENYRPAAQTENGAWYELTEAELRALEDTLEDAGLFVEAARAEEAAENAGIGDTVRVFLRDSN